VATVSGGADAAIAGLRNAQLSSKAGQSEMRIQMDAAGLGPVELRTWATGNRIATTITAARPEAHWLLSNGVGTLHQALSDHNLQVERIDVVWNAGGNASGRGGNPSTGGGSAGSNGQGAPRPWEGTPTAEPAVTHTDEATTSSGTISYLEGRLSVRV
jgi:hypothetical protein